MKNYEINSNTLAIIPLSKRKSIVYENHDCYVIESNVKKIMDDNCKYHGSSMEGRTKGTYTLTGFNYKAPIIVAEDKNIIFFPTCSPRLRECAWICLNNIDQIHSKQEKSVIDFLNNESLEFDTSYRIVSNQYLRSLKLEYSFKNRKNK